MTPQRASSPAGGLPPGTRILTDARQAALVAGRSELRRLAPLMQAELTASQLAGRLGMDVVSAFKLVQRLLRQGLIEETRREQRAGRALRYYRAPNAFFVPFEVRPFEQTGERNRAAGLQHFEKNLGAAMQQHWQQSAGRWGLLTQMTPSGEAYYQIASDQGEFFNPLAATSPLVLSGWNRVCLTPAEARTVQRQLWELLLPYFNRPAGQGQERDYQIGLFMVPDNQG